MEENSSSPAIVSAESSVLDLAGDIDSKQSFVTQKQKKLKAQNIGDNVGKLTVFRMPDSKNATCDDTFPIDSKCNGTNVQMSTENGNVSINAANVQTDISTKCNTAAKEDTLLGSVENVKLAAETDIIIESVSEKKDIITSTTHKKNDVQIFPNCPSGGDQSVNNAVVDDKIIDDYFPTELHVPSREYLSLQSTAKDSKMLSSECISDDTSIAHVVRSKRATRDEEEIPNKSRTTKKHMKTNVTVSLRANSRSKSVNSKSPDNSDLYDLKKWPSEERIMSKRANMRSENTEFVQKQMEFLQRVFHSSEEKDNDEAELCDNNKSKSSSESPTELMNNSRTLRRDQYLLRVSTMQPNSTQEVNESIAIQGNGDQQEIMQHSPALTVSEIADDLSILESTVSMSGLDGINTMDITSLESYLQTIWVPPPKPGSDSFCWKCHQNGVTLCCSKCVRSYHPSCVKLNGVNEQRKLISTDTWVCGECVLIENSINNPKRSRRNDLSIELLNQLLSFALKRMSYVNGHIDFYMPYEEHPSYLRYMINPVTFKSLQEKIEEKTFRNCDEFISETRWFLHNAYILSKGSGKTIITAKSIIKICRQEAMDIDTCAECYLNANTRTDWFVDVCTQPHLLLWAKLKGFPFWPAKSMGVSPNSLVNVRFFGEHDRAFVPIKDCYLYSMQDPNTQTGRRSARELADCIKEVDVHIERLRTKIGGFKYAPFKTPYDPNIELFQLEMMIPGVQEYIKRQQQVVNVKPSLQFKIYKTADNNLSIVQKANTPEQNILLDPVEENNSSAALLKKKNPEEKADNYKNIYECLEEQDAPKYEVVSKFNSDDSNSSKLSTVILKRKSSQMTSRNSITGGHEQANKKLMMSDDIENVSGKTLNKFNDEKQLQQPDAMDQNNGETGTKGGKEVLGDQIMPVKITSNINIGQREVAKPRKIIGPKSVSRRKNADKAMTMKHGINNVKKTNRSKKGSFHLTCMRNSRPADDATTEPLNNVVASNVEQPSTQQDSMEKSKDEKQLNNEEINNIFKSLVPFVEIKQEVISGDEADHPDICLDETCMVPNTAVQANNLHDSNEIPLPRPVVKEEVISDNESTRTTENTENSHNSNTTNCMPLMATDHCYEMPMPTDNLIGLIGSTAIQRISASNEDTSQANYGVSNPNLNNSGNSLTAAGIKYTARNPQNANPELKRNNSKRLPTTKTTPLIVDQQQPPQHTTPGISNQRKASKSAHINVRGVSTSDSGDNTAKNNLLPVIPNITFSTHSPTKSYDQKRISNKTTMVSIPIDNQANDGTSMNHTHPSSGNSIVTIPSMSSLTTIPYNVGTAHAPQMTGLPNSLTSAAAGGTMTYNMTGLTNVYSSAAIPVAAITMITTLPTNSSNYVITQGVTTIPTFTTTKTGCTLSNASVMQTAPPPLAGLSMGNNLMAGRMNSLNQNVPTVSTATPIHIMGNSVTPSMAGTITDIICQAPPKLIPRPLGALKSHGATIPPSKAGRTCKKLVDNAHKLTDFFITIMEDTLSDLAQADDLQSKIVLLSMELEKSKLAHQTEVAELKKNSDLLLSEMRKSMETEKIRLTNEIRKQCEEERIRAVEETKRKQWCAQCGLEANLYCCWNTSYCDYPCQQLHWAQHSINCTQGRNASNAAPTTSGSGGHMKTRVTPTVTTLSAVNVGRCSSGGGVGVGEGNQAPVGINITLNHQERQQNFKSSINTDMNVSNILAQNNKTLNSNQKKDKNNVKTVDATSLNTPIIKSSNATEVLKLPTNTYLRPITNSAVVHNAANSNLRCPTSYNIPIQRFNVALPITTPTAASNGGTLPAYTILQQNNSWVVSSVHSSTTNICSNSPVVSTPLSAGYIPPISITSVSTTTNNSHTMNTKPGTNNKGQSRQRNNSSQIKYF